MFLSSFIESELYCHLVPLLSNRDIDLRSSYLLVPNLFNIVLFYIICLYNSVYIVNSTLLCPCLVKFILKLPRSGHLVIPLSQRAAGSLTLAIMTASFLAALLLQKLPKYTDQYFDSRKQTLMCTIMLIR